MAQFTATWTNTEATDWEAGDYLRTDKFQAQVGQNLEFLGQSHDHSGDAGDGGTLAAADPKAIWFYAAPPGGPLA